MPSHEGFINANQAFYDLITLGKSFEEAIEGDKKSYTLRYIDWEHPENNEFHVTDEFAVAREGRNDTYRPDIILFVNGIPMVVIECKSPAVESTKSPVELGIEQHLRNSSKEGIRALYQYSNLLLSIAVNEASYATTGTNKEFWSKWREQFRNKALESNYYSILNGLKNKPLAKEDKESLFENKKPEVKRYFNSIDQEAEEKQGITEQDKLIFGLCRKDRLLDIFRNFILYDNGEKKIARYQQYFAVSDTLKRISEFDDTGKRKGGVIWHTQGSGKSLTMVMLAQLIAANKNIQNPKILLVTDRIDLDDQISDTFKKCQKEVRQAKTGSHLAALLEDNDDAIITTIINKFEAAVKQTKKPFLSPDIFVLVDEGHRTQYGTFNVNMQRVFPNACFVAFTGTPLMKKEKNTALKFGGYIGIPYTVTTAVEDGAVVPILYEGRHNLMEINEKPLNNFFDKVSEPLSDYGKAALKRKFNTINELNKAEQIVYARAWDISEHYSNFFQTQNEMYKPKAQLVAPTIKTALLYKEYLDEIGMVSSEVVVTQSDQREGTEDAYYSNNKEKKREEDYFNAMIDKYGDIKAFEKSIIGQFKKREHPEILIVVAKLLTGFDAPNNTILYLCRSLKEHTLLQAVARVNRVFPGKDYGYIIDYYGNLENLDSALSTYSGLKGFEEEDLSGMLSSINEEIKKLPQAHAEVWEIFKTLQGKSADVSAYEELLSAEDKRNKFYEKLSVYGRMLKLALSSVEFVTNTHEKKINTYKQDAKFFYKLRVDVKRRYNDDMAYKEFEPQIQKLINKHISTDGDILKITELVDIFNKEQRESEVEKIHGKAAQADHIASRTIKAINIKMQDDPVYYKKFAELIKQTIEDYHQKRIEEAVYLKKAREYEKKFFDGKRDDAPSELAHNEVALAFYNQSKDKFTNVDLLKSDFHVEVGKTVDEIVKKHIYINGKKVVDWQYDTDISGRINIDVGDAVYELLKKYDQDVNWEEIESLIEESLKIAVHKYK